MYDSVFEPELDYGDFFSDEKEEMTVFTSDEALTRSINDKGRVDIAYMSKISGIRPEKLVSDLRGKAILQDPAQFRMNTEWDILKGWVLIPQYVSGNCVHKYNEAQALNQRLGNCFESNLRVLRTFVPEEVSLEDIHISLGSPWVPAEIYSDFLTELFGYKARVKVVFNKHKGVWQVTPFESGFSTINNCYTYGTTEMSGIKIAENTMNSKTVKVYDYILTTGWKYEKKLNRLATLAAQEKQNLIIKEFEKWVFADEKRRKTLQWAYNESFVGYAFSPYDGSFLTLPDLNPDVEFYPHQKNIVARILLSGRNLLIAHDVGAGKTYEMIAGSHELYRLGLSKKNLIVTPNNVLKATVDTHRMLYPNDKILAVFPKDFTPKHRNETLIKIRDGDYTAVYMAYSSFDMVVMSKKYRINKMATDISDLKVAAASTYHKEEKTMLLRHADQLSKKLTKYIEEAQDTPWLCFDELGITTLFVDEAHNYKNIPLYTKADNIVGMHSKGSKKCEEMYEKCHTTDRVIFATGTPLTNSLADLFVLQSYLQPEDLKFHRIDTFDMWVNCFGERETNFEIDVDSSSLRPVTRFSTFHNLTELMSLFSAVCDFHHLDSAGEKLPQFDGYVDVCVPKCEAQSKYIASLAERTELIRNREVGRTEDNLLKVTTNGRKCALDVRLVDPAADIETSTKLRICAEKIYDIYMNFAGTCQAVFSDIGTPKSEFNVYDELKRELVLLGVPEYEIAFIHDAETETMRTRLFKEINTGKVRVIIGSTQKLGVGVNLQERLIALHHLSVPWRPADMVQREGRIIRRGNTCDKVFIYRYITEGSFDSYSWQLLENKQRFISSFLSGTSAARDMGDIADVVLSYAEVKALAIGNPLIKERVETSNRLERAKISCRQRQKQLMDLRRVTDSAPKEQEKLKRRIAVAEKDIELYCESKVSVSNTERMTFGEELITALKDNLMAPRERVFSDYQGFSVMLPASMSEDECYVYICSKNGGKYYLKMDTEKPLGCCKRIDYLLDKLPDFKASLEEELERSRVKTVQALQDLEKGNEYYTVIDKLTERLSEIDKQIA